MGVGISSIVFASNTIPTDFGLVLAAIAGAGSLLLIALRFVPEAKTRPKSVGIVLEAKTIDEIPTPIGC